MNDGVVVGVGDFTGTVDGSIWWEDAKCVLVQHWFGVVCWADSPPPNKFGGWFAKREKEDMIYNESCFDTLRKMKDKSVDFVFTSPPYNRKRNDKYTFYNDIVVNYFDMIDNLISELLRVSKKYVFINIMKNYYNSSDVYRIFGKYHDKIAEVFVWEKSNPQPSPDFSITNSFEYIIAFGEKGLKSNKSHTKNHITTSVAKMLKDHKAVMHSDVSDFFIGNIMNRGDHCYDPFIGTGTTAISCNKYGVEWSGSEIVKEYVDMAKRRIKEAQQVIQPDNAQ